MARLPAYRQRPRPFRSTSAANVALVSLADFSASLAAPMSRDDRQPCSAAWAAAGLSVSAAAAAASPLDQAPRNRSTVGRALDPDEHETSTAATEAATIPASRTLAGGERIPNTGTRITFGADPRSSATPEEIAGEIRQLFPRDQAREVEDLHAVGRQQAREPRVQHVGELAVVVEPPEGGPGHDQAGDAGGDGPVELGQGVGVGRRRAPVPAIAFGEGTGRPAHGFVDAPLVL